MSFCSLNQKFSCRTYSVSCYPPSFLLCARTRRVPCYSTQACSLPGQRQFECRPGHVISPCYSWISKHSTFRSKQQSLDGWCWDALSCSIWSLVLVITSSSGTQKTFCLAKIPNFTQLSQLSYYIVVERSRPFPPRL